MKTLKVRMFHNKILFLLKFYFTSMKIKLIFSQLAINIMKK